jgi:hypothetical protein
MIATQTGASIPSGEALGTQVQLRSNRSGVISVLALDMALGLALCGCANVDWDTSQAWFTKPLDITGRNAGGYTFSELAETKQRERPITANELVDSRGACPPPAAPQVQAGPGSQNTSTAADTTSLLGGGIGLGMSECDVVFRAGTPSAVQLGNNPNGDRTAVLTFTGGPRPGVYHFERGALMQMDSVAQSAAAAPAQAPQPVKKKSKPPKKNDQTPS